MAVSYFLPRGTKAALDTLAGASGLKVGQQYYLTDREQVVIADTTSSYIMEPKITVASVAPSSPQVGDIWIDTT